MPLLDPVSFCPMCFLCSFSRAHNKFVLGPHLAPCSGSSGLFRPAVSVTGVTPFDALLSQLITFVSG